MSLAHSTTIGGLTACRNATEYFARTALIAVLSLAAAQPAWAQTTDPNPPPTQLGVMAAGHGVTVAYGVVAPTVAGIPGSIAAAAAAGVLAGSSTVFGCFQSCPRTNPQIDSDNIHR
jgi:hypothetical protein